MPSFSRRLGRWDARRVAAVGIAVAWIGLLAAYVFAAATTGFGAGAGIAAAGSLAIAAAGFMYAWREPAPLDR